MILWKISANSGIEIKQFRSSDNSNIIVNTFISVKKRSWFWKENLLANICIVDLTDFIYNLQLELTH